MRADKNGLGDINISLGYRRPGIVSSNLSLYSMARNDPDKESRRRVEETSGMRKANGKMPQSLSLTSSPGSSNVSRTPPRLQAH